MANDRPPPPGFRDATFLVTGGAGFIGSHLVDRLLAGGASVVAYDNFSEGHEAHLAEARATGRLRIVRGDVLDRATLAKAMGDVGAVFHLAADRDVRTAARDTGGHLRQNVEATHSVLEAMRSAGVPRIVFTSTSAVYGEATVIPTPETYGPLEPISLYGASKLAGEAIVSAYCHSFGLRGLSLRFANVVGPRSDHGVTHDFVRKLLQEARFLEILGDGRQRKSYCHVEDCVDGVLHAFTRAKGTFDVFNLGSEDAIDVLGIAGIVASVLDLRDVDLRTTGGVDGGRGWVGDVRSMRLDLSKIGALGWRPRRTSAEAIRATAEHLRGFFRN